MEKKLQVGGSGGNEKTTRIWDSANGKVLHSLVGHTFKEGHDFITSVAWSPNGKAIVSSTLQGEVKVWSMPK